MAICFVSDHTTATEVGQLPYGDGDQHGVEWIYERGCGYGTDHVGTRVEIYVAFVDGSSLHRH